jgi:hypothetical protein
MKTPTIPRRPLLVLVGAFLGLSVLGGATGVALGATGAASSSSEHDGANHHQGDRDAPRLER